MISCTIYSIKRLHYLVSVADRAKSEDFDLLPDVDLTGNILKFFYLIEEYSLRAFNYRLETATLRELRRRGAESPPPRDVFSRIPQRSAGYGDRQRIYVDLP